MTPAKAKTGLSGMTDTRGPGSWPGLRSSRPATPTLETVRGLHHLAGETFRAEEEPREARLWGTVAESHERPGAGPG